MRIKFEGQKKLLKENLVILSSLVEQQILGSVKSFANKDLNEAKRIVEADDKINRKRYEIEERTLITIATQQPMARDLRLLASVLEIAGELERIGDYAKGIAKINIRMGEEQLLTPLVIIPKMAEKTAEMLHRAVNAFVTENADEAAAIPLEDDEVDQMYEEVYQKMTSFIAQDGKDIQRANWIIWVAHNLERVADRVTNICERTIFTVTGEINELKSSDI